MAARKRIHPSAHAATAQGTANSIADSAQKIWLAGLGAFERARAEGPRMFDLLVEQGMAIGGRAREAADEALRMLDRATRAQARKTRARAAPARRKAKVKAASRKSTATRRKARRRS